MSAAAIVGAIIFLLLIVGAVVGVVVLQKKGLLSKTLAPATTMPATTLPPTVIPTTVATPTPSPTVAPATAAPVTMDLTTAAPLTMAPTSPVPVPTSPVPVPTTAATFYLYTYPGWDAPGNDLASWPVLSFPFASITSARAAYPSMVGWVNDGQTIWLKSAIGPLASTSVPGKYVAAFARIASYTGGNWGINGVTGDLSPARWVSPVSAATSPAPTLDPHRTLHACLYPGVDCVGNDIASWPISSYPYTNVANAIKAYPNCVGWVYDSQNKIVFLKSAFGGTSAVQPSKFTVTLNGALPSQQLPYFTQNFYADGLNITSDILYGINGSVPLKATLAPVCNTSACNAVMARYKANSWFWDHSTAFAECAACPDISYSQYTAA